MSPSPSITSNDTAAAKQLAIDLEESAKRLFALLKEEDRWKDTREEALRLLQQEEENGDDAIGPYGSALTASLGALQDEVQTMEERVRTLAHSHSSLTAKIDKIKKNLRRAEEQEADLLNIRPSYMDEYEMLEDELQDLHQDYVVKVRNVHYLQKELKKYDRREAKDVKRAEAKRMELREKILAEEQAGPEGANEEEEDGMEPQGGGGSEDVGIERPGTAATTRLSIARSDGSSSISSVAGARSLSPNESDSDSDSAW